GRYLPNRVVTGMVAGDARAAAGIPLLQGREAVEGKPTAYVCRNYACELPITDRAALARQLEGARAGATRNSRTARSSLSPIARSNACKASALRPRCLSR